MPSSQGIPIEKKAGPAGSAVGSSAGDSGVREGGVGRSPLVAPAESRVANENGTASAWRQLGLFDVVGWSQRQDHGGHHEHETSERESSMRPPLAKARPTQTPTGRLSRGERYELAGRFDCALAARAGDPRYSNSAVARRLGVDERRVRDVRNGDRPFPEAWIPRLDESLRGEVLGNLERRAA